MLRTFAADSLSDAFDPHDVATERRLAALFQLKKRNISGNEIYLDRMRDDTLFDSFAEQTAHRFATALCIVER